MRKYLFSVALLVILSATIIALVSSAAGTGTIEGKVTYTGTPPKMKPIDMSKEPTCAKEHNPPELVQTVTTGAGDSIQYAVVYISKGGAEETTPPSEGVRYDQKGCMYTPHVLVMEVGQDLKIYNNDPVAHNIHPMPKQNVEWNKSQPPGTPAIDTKWDKPEFISVKCNIHPWVHGYFVVLKTSNYAVTGADGSFSLKGLPPGTYTVTSWQEQYGFQSQDVTLGAGETKSVNFSYKVTPYLF